MIQLPLLFVILGWAATLIGLLGVIYRSVRTGRQYVENWLDVMDARRRADALKEQKRIMQRLDENGKQLQEVHGLVNDRLDKALEEIVKLRAQVEALGGDVEAHRLRG